LKNAIFVAKKPMFVSSNRFLGETKRKYGVKKAGFSGTLDPFACGNLVIAFGQYTKLFRFLKKVPKRYRATIWLGVRSDSFDIENIESIKIIDKFDKDLIENSLLEFKGEVEYTPPKYCAKKINGVKAYDLARKNKEVNLKKQIMSVFDIELLNYSHPFVSFEVSLSEGGYVRSIASLLSDKLDSDMTLCYLERLSEGDFIYENEKFLNPTKHLNLPKNEYLRDMEDFLLGRKLNVDDFKIKTDGNYLLEFEKFFSVIEIVDKKVKYLLNKVDIC